MRPWGKKNMLPPFPRLVFASTAMDSLCDAGEGPLFLSSVRRIRWCVHQFVGARSSRQFLARSVPACCVFIQGSTEKGSEEAYKDAFSAGVNVPSTGPSSSRSCTSGRERPKAKHTMYNLFFLKPSAPHHPLKLRAAAHTVRGLGDGAYYAHDGVLLSWVELIHVLSE